MSMYVELLSSAADGTRMDLTGDELVGYVLSCRAEMLAADPYKGTSAYCALAAEVAYDHALLTICMANDIAVVAADFAHPSEERKHLEAELMGAGIDLAVLSRRRGSRYD